MGNYLFNFWNSFANIFHIFAIYLFYESFLRPKEKITYKKYCFMAYCLVLTFTQLFAGVIGMNFIVNIVSLFALTFLYDSNMARRVLAVGFVAAFTLLVEDVGLVLSGLLSYSLLGSRPEGIPPILPVCEAILALGVALLYKKWKGNREEVRVPRIYWITVSVVPFSCIYVLFLVYSFKNIATWQMFSVVAIMFAITLCVFLLYEKQIQFFREKNREKVLEVQNAYYQKQLDYIMAVEKSTKNLRHDMKNYLSVITEMAEEEGNQEIVDYVNEMCAIWREKA